MTYGSLLILIPLAAVLLLNLPRGRFIKTAAFWAVLALCVLQAAALTLLPPDVWLKAPCSCGWMLSLRLLFDGISLVTLLSISIVAAAAAMVGRATIQDEDKQFNFMSILLIIMTGMNGSAMVADLFSLYIFMEITSVSSFILIAFHKDGEGLEGSFKYLVLSSVATAFMLSAIAFLMMAAGDTTFHAIKEAVSVHSSSVLVILGINLFLAGLLIKGGLVPFHGWLPDAYSAAPAAVSVLLAGIITKTAGIYGLMRVSVSAFGFPDYVKALLMFIGALSIVVGALAALGQKDFKRLLAYSSISQVGYIVLGLGTGTPLGLAGAVFHFFNHAVFKSLLFVNSAAVEKQTGTRDIDKLGGLGTVMPVTAGSSAAAFLSTSGIPPLSGFWSKLIIILALWQGAHYTYAGIAIAASLLTLAYFLFLQRQVFFGITKDEFKGIKEPGSLFTVTEIVLAGIIIGVGLLYPYVLDKLILPVQSLIP